MNEDQLKNMPEYVKRLPKNIQNMIFKYSWEEKTLEIGKKYSLDENQQDILANEVLFVLIGLSDLEQLQSILKNEIKVSDLLKDQIIEDLEKRVFEPALKEIEPKNPESKSGGVDILPEIRPDNLPAVENVNQTATSIKTSVPVYTPKPKVIVEKEPVQSPVSVPRFKAVPMGDEEMIGQNFIPNIAPKPNASGIIESKLNSITKSVGEGVKNEPPKAYTKDPYREPLN